MGALIRDRSDLLKELNDFLRVVIVGEFLLRDSLILDARSDILLLNTLKHSICKLLCVVSFTINEGLHVFIDTDTRRSLLWRLWRA